MNDKKLTDEDFKRIVESFEKMNPRLTEMNFPKHISGKQHKQKLIQEMTDDEIKELVVEGLEEEIKKDKIKSNLTENKGDNRPTKIYKIILPDELQDVSTFAIKMEYGVLCGVASLNAKSEMPVLEFFEFGQNKKFFSIFGNKWSYYLYIYVNSGMIYRFILSASQADTFIFHSKVKIHEVESQEGQEVFSANRLSDGQYNQILERFFERNPEYRDMGLPSHLGTNQKPNQRLVEDMSDEELDEILINEIKKIGR